ncbi:fused DSP-PTPase phosphatase/NAD kinase-like protein [Uliginosibacterium sp. H1]|uniref:fused DSP-PTPase phosphatase/NAD kinase-like protein n=1 Tax=Uliginosibacterium sp. H1 TaxID=3114757 RepID=UPI002E18C918|nr:tyrosine protein phosphatase [Uliginosibacterium sp. H1]
MARDLSTLPRRFLAWLEYLFVDHGLFRELYNNFYALPGGMFRASQPSPRQIRKYQRKHGLRSIINLRGEDDSLRYAMEADACSTQGIALVDFKGIKSREMPTRETLHETKRIFDSVEYPALMHCKSGADRAGLASVLYRHFRLGESIEQAQHELDWKYGHNKAAKTGMLDFMLETYIARNRREPIDFMTWVDTEYDRKELESHFHSRGWADFITDKVLKRE